MSAVNLINKFAETVQVTRFDASVQQQVLEFDADFVVGNVVDLDVNGVAITPVPFNTDQATTMNDLASAIQANADIASATVTGPRELTLVSEHKADEFLVGGIIVTGGLTQPNGSITGTSGGYVDGVFQPGGISTFDIRISLQPYSSEEMLALSEGERTRRHMKGYTVTRLFNAKQSRGARSDRLTYDGTVFEVQEVERWKQTKLNHFKVIIAEINPT